LCDLVGFERLARAERQRGNDSSSRDEFSQLCSPGVCRAIGRPTLPQAGGFDNAGLNQIAVAAPV
jgi:hypothetical protein